MSMGKKNMVMGNAEVTRCVGIPFSSGQGHVKGLVTKRKTLSHSIVGKPSAFKYNKLRVSRCNWCTQNLTLQELDLFFSPHSFGKLKIYCFTQAEDWGFSCIFKCVFLVSCFFF